MITRLYLWLLPIGTGIRNFAASEPARLGASDEVLVFEDNFDDFNLDIWKHDITMVRDDQCDSSQKLVKVLSPDQLPLFVLSMVASQAGGGNW